MLSAPPSRQPWYATRSYAERMLKEHLGPTVSIQRITECGVPGARVVQRERGVTYVLATCFSGDPDDRPQLAALWAIRGATKKAA